MFGLRRFFRLDRQRFENRLTAQRQDVTPPPLTADIVRRIVQETVAAELPRLRAEIEAAQKPVLGRVRTDDEGLRTYIGRHVYDPRV